MRKIAALALALAGCAGQPQTPTSEGRSLYLAKCTSCHRIYEPAELSPEKWTATVAKMEALKKVRLNEEQRALILQYLTGDPAGGRVAHAR